MTTSGVSTFTLTRDDAITLALRKLNVLELGQTPDAITITQANLSLNVMLKAWQTQGIKLWTVNDLIIPYTASKTTYSIGPSGADITNPRPLKVIQSYLKNKSITPNTDVTMTILSKQEYIMLGSKASTGVTNSIFYDPLTPNGVLSVYLTPDAFTTTNYELHLVYQRPIQDMVSSTDNFDLPAEWMQAIVWGLADELAEDYSTPPEKANRITLKAEMYRRQLEDWDVEAPSSFFQPDYRMQYQQR